MNCGIPFARTAGHSRSFQNRVYVAVTVSEFAESPDGLTSIIAAMSREFEMMDVMFCSQYLFGRGEDGMSSH